MSSQIFVRYMWRLVICVILTMSLPCKWDMSITPEQAAKLKCGNRCADFWAAKDPHYCGNPDPCCCAPVCDIEAARKTAFFGVNWSDQYTKRRLPRTHQFQLLKDSGFKHIKTFNPIGLKEIKKVYGPTGARVYLGIANNELTALSTDKNYARLLVRTKILPYESLIAMILVGNEPLICIKTKNWLENRECGTLSPPTKLLAAMKNIHEALKLEGMPRKVTSVFNGGIINMASNPWTPCIADFKPFLKPILEPIWQFLRENDAPFIVNIYSWFACMDGNISPKLATGVAEPSAMSTDGKYKYYFNIDAQFDMIRIAQCKNKVADLDVWLGETGWPTGDHIKANNDNSLAFISSIVERQRGNLLNDPTKDMIRFRGLPTTMFYFEAFDEEKKFQIEHGNRFENTFGLFYEDGTPKWRDHNGMIFFPLKEESQVFRKKEKKEKALHRLAEKELKRNQEIKLKASVDPLLSNKLAPNIKWSDVVDDDEEDEDYEKDNLLNQFEKFEETSEEISEDEEEGSELEHVRPIETIQPSEIVLPRIVIPQLTKTNRPLTRKERLEREQRENEDFDALLQDMGLTPKLEKLDSSINENVTQNTTQPSKKKKKKKKNETVNLKTVESSENNVVLSETTTSQKQQVPVPSEQPTITKEQALAAARKAATSKKNKTNCVVTETVLAEAKKKAELKKSKQKKEKHTFEH